MITLARYFLILWCTTLAPVLLAAKAGEPGGPGEYRDFKVLKSYSAKEGDHLFHAFVIEWEGQEVIAVDTAALIKARSDDVINVLVSRGLPRGGETRGRILFLARPEKKPPVESARSRGPSIDYATANPPTLVELRVNRVFALKNSDYDFRAYEVEWKGQAVIVTDPAASSTYDVGDRVPVMIGKLPYPDRSQPHGLLTFYLSRLRPVGSRR